MDERTAAALALLEAHTQLKIAQAEILQLRALQTSSNVTVLKRDPEAITLPRIPHESDAS